MTRKLGIVKRRQVAQDRDGQSGEIRQELTLLGQRSLRGKSALKVQGYSK